MKKTPAPGPGRELTIAAGNAVVWSGHRISSGTELNGTHGCVAGCACCRWRMTALPTVELDLRLILQLLHVAARTLMMLHGSSLEVTTQWGRESLDELCEMAEQRMGDTSNRTSSEPL